MRKNLEVEIKVGIFVMLGVVLAIIAILSLGGTTSIFSKHNSYSVHFQNIDGLISGAKVVLSGVHIGEVSDIQFDRNRRDINVTIKVNKSFAPMINEGSTAELVTQGVLGDKFLTINQGPADAPPLPENSILPTRPSQSLTHFLSKGDQLMVTLNSIAHSLDNMLKTLQAGNRSETIFEGLAGTAKNLSQVTAKLNKGLEDNQLRSAIQNLNEILKKINSGSGTLGALVNDPGLYDDVKSLVGGANHNRIIRNLVRQTIRKSDELEAKEQQESQQPTPQPQGAPGQEQPKK